MNDQNRYQGLSDEVTRAFHASKSFTGWAFLILILYWFVFYVPGLILNLAMLVSANRSKTIVGRSPSGYGCLVWLLVIHVILPGALLLMAIIFSIDIISNLPFMR